MEMKLARACRPSTVFNLRLVHFLSTLPMFFDVEACDSEGEKLFEGGVVHELKRVMR